MARLTNEEVANASEAAAMKYAAMAFENANLTFAFELQGYVKAMVTTHKMDMDIVLGKILELAGMFKNANR
jgi:hypothetical protein